MADLPKPPFFESPAFRTLAGMALTVLLTLLAARYGIAPAPLPPLQPVEQHFYGVVPHPVGDAK